MDNMVSKATFKEMVLTKISAHYEEELRNRASVNSKMTFLNVAATGLRGRHHPVLSNVVTSAEVKTLRPVLKCLTGDYYCYALRSAQTGGSDHCRICPDQDGLPRPTEDIVHVLTECSGTQEVREPLLADLTLSFRENGTPIDLTQIMGNSKMLAQFLLDNTSLNLPNGCRVNISVPSSNTFKLI